MALLSLDISSKTGWALFNDTTKKLANYGSLVLPQKINKYGKHPWGTFLAAKGLAQLIEGVVDLYSVDKIVIEETNGARARFTQKFLEYCHFAVLDILLDKEVFYINTSEWRKISGVRLDKEQKKQNAKLSKSKRLNPKVDKKTLGISGKTTLKHVAVKRAKELYGVELKQKENDIADAILLGHAFLNGAAICTGK